MIARRLRLLAATKGAHVIAFTSFLYECTAHGVCLLRGTVLALRRMSGRAHVCVNSLIIWLATPMLVMAEEPLQVIRDAWAASSSELTSGSGKGMYRCYEAVGTGEWNLTIDAEIIDAFSWQKLLY